MQTLKTVALAAFAAAFGIVVAPGSAHAQCGGGAYRAGGYGGGFTFGKNYGGTYGYRSGGGCGMMMGGMNMGGMQMPAAQAATATMPGMNMNGSAAPAAAPAPASAAPAALSAPAAATTQYHCPHHPGVVASFQATCPYCGMALTR